MTKKSVSIVYFDDLSSQHFHSNSPLQEFDLKLTKLVQCLNTLANLQKE